MSAIDRIKKVFGLLPSQPQPVMKTNLVTGMSGLQFSGKPNMAPSAPSPISPIGYVTPITTPPIPMAEPKEEDDDDDDSSIFGTLATAALIGEIANSGSDSGNDNVSQPDVSFGSGGDFGGGGAGGDFSPVESNSVSSDDSSYSSSYDNSGSSSYDSGSSSDSSSSSSSFDSD